MANGILVIDKSAGWTSQDVAAKLRGVFHERRVGHGGTLDPMATGVLPVFIGRATRAAEFLESAEKEYVAGLRLGVVTDTQDTSGTVLETNPVCVTCAQLEAALRQFLGPIEQIPPMYSAIKINGQKLYELARRGQEVARRPRSITIHALELLEGEGADWTIRVRCSKGTYVRTLCHDIGGSMGVPAHMSFLLRTRSGAFELDGSFTIDELKELKEKGELYKAVIPMEQALMHIGEARMTLNKKGERFLTHGAEVVCPGIEELPKDTPLRAYCNGKFLGIAKSNGEAVHICTFLGQEEE
jgi:tRNA pseudouridine55 synthase